MVFAFHGLLTQCWSIVASDYAAMLRYKAEERTSQLRLEGGPSLANPNIFRPDKIIHLPDLGLDKVLTPSYTNST